jgi:hypothetical protein
MQKMENAFPKFIGHERSQSRTGVNGRAHRAM